MATPSKRFALTASERDQLSNDIGLSPITLARFLGGHLELPESTARRVEACILDLGLGKDSACSVPRVVLIVPDLSSPYFCQLAHSIAGEVTDRGWDLVVAVTGNDVRREIRMLNDAGNSGIVGVLLFTNNGSADQLLRALEGRNDVIGFGEALAPGTAHTVLHDFQSVGRLAGRHLRELGHHRVAFIGGMPNLRSSRLIVSALSRELGAGKAAGVEYREIFGEHSETHGEQAMLRLARKQALPTAIFAGSSPIAHGVVRACRELGLAIPGDVSLISFDGAGAPDLIGPTITSITVSTLEIARRGLALLGRRRAGQSPAITETVDVRLDVRGSTAAPKVSCHAA
jgi:DNA-binding LacI/PurR family transcriptional regulator